MTSRLCVTGGVGATPQGTPSWRTASRSTSRWHPRQGSVRLRLEVVHEKRLTEWDACAADEQEGEECRARHVLGCSFIIKGRVGRGEDRPCLF